MTSTFVEDIRIHAVIILDSSGSRIFSKYFTPRQSETHAHNDSMTTSTGFPQSLEQQRQIEQTLIQKSNKQKFQPDVEIIQTEQYIAVYRQFENIRLFILIPSEENELLAASILTTIADCMASLFDQRVNRENVLSSLDLVMIAVDECIDDGMILELDSAELLRRVSMRDTSNAPGGPSASNQMFMGGGSGHLPGQQQEHTLSSALGMATNALWRSFRSG